jgi:Lipocalin-like domain
MSDEKLGFLKGSWDLLEATFTASDGSIQMPWGPSPVGIGLISESGDFSAHVMRAHRDRFAADHPTPAEKHQAYDDYFSYFGRILRFDGAEGIMISRVEGASNPNWIGGEQVRYLDIEDQDHIVFRTPPVSFAGTKLVGRLRWQRRRRDAA